MSSFENVTVTRQANVYFEGHVTSRTIQFAGGAIKTLGVMLPGEYKFGTDKAEIMEIQSGEVSVLLPDERQWKSYSAGEQFSVKANASFQIKALTITDYCCSFID